MSKTFELTTNMMFAGAWSMTAGAYAALGVRIARDVLVEHEYPVLLADSLVSDVDGFVKFLEFGGGALLFFGLFFMALRGAGGHNHPDLTENH